MPEHVHLLITEPDKPLAKAIQALKVSVSKKLPQTPFWLPRYHDRNITNHEAVIATLRYIHRNPVKTRPGPEPTRLTLVHLPFLLPPRTYPGNDRPTHPEASSSDPIMKVLMFKLLLPLLGGTLLLLLAIVVVIAIFIYRVRPTTPGATVGFSPQQLIQTPTIFVPMLVIFAVEFAATFYRLHRP